MKILNLTQYFATPEQIEAGVFEPEDKRAVQKLLTFDEPPCLEEVMDRLVKLVLIVKNHDCDSVMIGGVPFMIYPMVSIFLHYGIKCVFSFSKRETVETMKEDGTVIKTSVFKHVDFVESLLQ